MIYLKTELSHHGVKGMKWGVRKERKMQDKFAKSISDVMYFRNEKSKKAVQKLEKKFKKKYGDDFIKMTAKQMKSGEAAVDLIFKSNGASYYVTADSLIKYK